MKNALAFSTRAALLAFGCVSASVLAASDAVTGGVSPASSTYSAFSNGSIARDSRLSTPLELLDDFYPSVTVTYSDHDNVRRRADVQEPDSKLYISPNLAYRSSLGRHPFYVAYTGVFTFHSELDIEDAQSHVFDGNISFDLSNSWDLDLFASLGKGFEERGISGTRSLTGRGADLRAFEASTEVNRGPDEYEFEAYGFDLAYGRKNSRLAAVVGYEHREFEFINNDQGLVNPSGARDRESDAVHLDVDYRFGDSTSVFGRLQYTETDYARSLNQLDHDQTDWMIGLRWRPNSRLSGALGIGETERDFVDPTRLDYDGSSYYANLQYEFTPFSRLSLAASQFVEEPGDEFADYYESQLFGATYNHSFTDLLSGGVYLKVIEDEFNNGRVDDFTDFGISLDYAWRDWLTAGLYYGQIERESNVLGIAYDDTYFGIRIHSDLRSLMSSKRDDEYLEPYSFEEDQEARDRYRRDRIQATQPNN